MSEISSFKKILAYTPQPSILLQVIDRELLIVGANNASLQLLGAKEDNIIQKHLFNTPNWGLSGINSDVVAELKSNLDKAILTKATIQLTEQSVSIFYVSQNKVTQFFISFTITPIAEESTKKIGFVLLSLDNDTEKVALKQDKAQYQSMLNDCKNDLEEIENRLLIGRWEIDIVSKKIWRSDEIYNICGYEPQSFDPSERQQFSVTHPDDIESARITLEQTIRYGTPFSIERRLIKANGEIIYVLSKGKAVLNDAGEIIKVKGFFQDITQQVVQKDTINSVRINQEALINGTNDLVWLMDKQMQVVLANDAYYNKMQELADGYTKNHNEEVVNTKNERQKRWTNLIPEVLKGNSLTFKENILSPLSNSYEYALVTLNPIKNDKGEVINIACFAKDITVETYNLQTLETTKTRLENILTASPDIICSIDGNAIFLDVNAASEKILGYKPEEMIGKSIAAFLPPEDLAKTLAEAPKVRESGVLIHFENRYIKKDGGIINVSWTGSYLAEKDILHCVGRDVTDKKKQEAALEASQKDYKYLFENNPSPMFIWDLETYNIIECNTEMLLLYGYTKEELIQNSLFTLVNEEDIEKVKNTIYLQNTQSRFSRQGARHKKKNGDIIYIDITTRILDYQGKKCSLVLINDITEKLQAQNALVKSEKDYKNLFENNPSALLIWDFKTKNIIECNNNATILYGYSKQELLQLNMRDIRPQNDNEAFETVTESETAYVNATTEGWRHKKKNGDVFSIDVSKHLIDYKGVRCALIMVNDITEKIKTQKIIAESEAKYRSFFENSIDGIFITRKSGGILDVNPSGCKMLQMTKEEICRVGRNGTVDTSDPRLTTFLETRQELGYAKGIVTHIRKDGSRFEAEVSSSTFINANGEEENALIVRDITERIKNQEQIKESNERFNYVSKATSDAIWDWDLNTNHIFWGEGFQNIFGYSKDDIVPTLEFREQRIHPRDKERVMEGMFVVIKSKNNIWEDSYRFMKADGSYAQVLNRGFVIRDEQGRAIRMVGAKRDISQYQYYNDLEKLERNILAINEAGDKSLEEVLSIYLLGIEVLHPSMICSILQLKGQQLYSLAAPSLPEAYSNAINGGFIGENAGSCGTAAFTKKNVIATDIENDPRWADYKSIALEYNLRACWSHPIFNQKGEVMATFAAYYQHPKTPSVLEENTIARANNILKIILESYARTKALKESNERYNLATKATSDAIWDWDLETGSMIWTEGWQSIFGYNLQNIPNDISFKLQNTHPDDVEKIRASYYKIVKSKDINWVEQYKFKKANGEFAYVISKGFVVRDEEGRAIRMVGATSDITKRKQEELRLKLLESVITNTNDAVLITDSEPLDMPGPRIVYVNEAFTTMTGYTAEEVIGDTPRILQGPKSNRNELDRLKEALKRWESCEATLLNFRKDGSEFWVNINISPVADETGWYTHWVAIQRDITEKVLEEQNLTKAIIKAQENERYEIGGELHDNVCQILTSSQLSLKMLKKVLGPKELIWYEKGTEAITLASREIRNLSHRLAPSFFNDTTLELAITTLVQTFNIEEKYQIHILFDDKFKAQPTKQEFQINLYRIVQEQLKNIFKYAEATTIEIVGTVKSKKLKMEIVDNGLGFDASKNYTGIGMANMKRRTELFLGKFEVISAVGKGCKIVIEVPIEEVN